MPIKNERIIKFFNLFNEILYNCLSREIELPDQEKCLGTRIG